MKKTIYMLPAFALMLFAACSSEDAVTTESPAQLNETPENAIGFGAYINRSVTRAGVPGVLTTSGGTNNLQDDGVGFGVFAYYGDGDLYSENLLPNFMYNQSVTYSGGNWTYAPVKYWPNEFGSSAISTGVDRVTFFAYAPYVATEPTTGQLTSYYDNTDGTKSTQTGITALTRNGKSGDPYVKYVGAYNPAKCVDLCWGVAKDRYTSSADASDGVNDIAAGEPYINVAKPQIGADINFLFKHALAKLIVKVDADVNSTSHAGDDVLNPLTRVWIRSVTFDGIAPKGYLNLHTGYWYDAVDNDKISRANVTIHDGRRDGSEATAADTYESPSDLNTNLVQNAEYTTTTAIVNGLTTYNGITTPTATCGVTKDYQNLFSATADAPILVIPANEQLKVTIVYDVETADASLPTYLSDGKTKGSTVENKISKYITIGNSPLKLEANHTYNINLHLGMNSVTFNASISDWDPGDTPDDIWLPQNVLSVANGSTSTIVTVPAGTTGYKFKVTGLPEDKTVSASIDPNPSSSVTVTPSPSTVTAGGETEITISNMAANTTTSTVTNTCTVSCNGTNTIVTINQAPHPLELQFVSLSGTELELSIATLTTPANLAGASSISVLNTITDIDLYSSVSGNTVTLSDAPSPGDKLKITVTSGEVTESIPYTVPDP